MSHDHKLLPSDSRLRRPARGPSARLSDVCVFKHGGTPSKANSAYWSGAIPWISPKDMAVERVDDGEDHISEDAVAASATQVVGPGALLAVIRSGILARRVPIAVVDGRVAFNQDIKAIIPNPSKLDTEYLALVLKANEPRILAEGVKKGPTVHSLRSGYLEGLIIPLPPLGEQKQIAARLREQLAVVERAKSATVARLSGAEALVPAQLRHALEGAAAGSWPRRTLRDVARKIDYGHTASADRQSTGPRFLRITDIQGGAVQWDEVPGVEISETDEASKRLMDGDVVIARTGGTVGKSFLIRRPPRAVFASYLIRITPSEVILPEFLNLFLQSDDYWRQLRSSARGGAQPNVNATLLGELRLPVPAKAEQESIVRTFGARAVFTSHIRETVREELDSLSRMPAAFLRAAFQGDT